MLENTRSRKNNSIAKTVAETVRVDKWLWAARFFKTRQLAAQAVSGGKVHVDGQRVKPSKQIRPTMKLTIHKGDFEYQIVVVGISDRRGPAKEAVQLYEETTESVAAREERRLQLQIQRETNASLARNGRPDKRQRRAIVKFRNKIAE